MTLHRLSWDIEAHIPPILDTCPILIHSKHVLLLKICELLKLLLSFEDTINTFTIAFHPETTLSQELTEYSAAVSF